MSEFNMSSWLKDQYLTEAGLGSTKSQSLANAINTAMLQIDDSMSYTDFAEAVASILIDEYGTHNFAPFMEVLHARLGMNTNNVSPDIEDMFDYQDRVMDMGINKSINEEETKLDTYKLTLTLSDPYEGGPGDWVDEEVKIDSSLGGDEVKTAIKNALMDSGYSRRDIYKIEDIKKIN